MSHRPRHKQVPATYDARYFHPRWLQLRLILVLVEFEYYFFWSPLTQMTRTSLEDLAQSSGHRHPRDLERLSLTAPPSAIVHAVPEFFWGLSVKGVLG